MGIIVMGIWVKHQTQSPGPKLGKQEASAKEGISDCLQESFWEEV